MDITQNKLFKNLGYINGEWIDSTSGQYIEVTNPANQEILTKIPAFTPDEVNTAITAAETAFLHSKKVAVKQRTDILKQWFSLIIEHKQDLAQILTLEQGKPLKEAAGEILYAASFIEWFAEEGRRMYGSTIPAPTNDKRLITIQQPVGVCVAITPWNFPAAMITRKVAPALAAGCSIIVKPAQETPLTALALAYLAEQAGIPKGVLTIITGQSTTIVPVLTESPIVKKLSFTGSTAVGGMLMAQCAPTIKNISLELGGNAPLIVFDDADLDTAVQGTMDSKFRNAGQTCVCSNRIYVHRSIEAAFTKRLIQKVKQLKVGNGLEPDTDIGALINQKAVQKIQAHIQDALQQGGQVAIGGKQSNLGGNFFEPTVITNAKDSMLCFQEETFAPLAPISVFDTEEAVITRANATEYGLASYIFTQNLNRSLRVSEALEFGMVGINTGLISTTEAPFGGVKTSGIGREGAKQGLEEYTELKYLCVGGLMP